MADNVCAIGNNSPVLKDKIFGEQPRACGLQNLINAQLAQLCPTAETNSKVQEVVCRIGSISETLASLVGETRAEIVGLYTETITMTHLGNYSNQVAVLESHQRNRVAGVLGASNDDNYSQVA